MRSSLGVSAWLACTCLGLVIAVAPASAQNARARDEDAYRAELERELASLERAQADGHGDRAQRDPAELFHAGWLCFLLDRPVEALRRFSRVLDASTEGALHDDALQMMGALLADRDWDRDGREDPTTVRARLEDAQLVAQDRPWIAALYLATARGLHLTSRDADAITLLEAALARWPRMPIESTVLEAACARHRARQSTARLQASLPEVDAICARRAAP